MAGRFKDNKQPWSVNIKHNINMATAEWLNTMRWKWDIFFTPNWDYKKFFWLEESKSEKWRSESTIESIEWNIYALVADNDLWEKIREQVWLKPTVAVKTKHWYHMYFILKNPVSFKDNKQRFKNLEDKLIPLLHADAKARDWARILRVPWFTYRADNLWEDTILVEEYNPEEMYSFDERERKISKMYTNICLDDVDKQIIKKKFKWSRMNNLISSVFDDVKNHIHVTDVLWDIYPQFQANADWSISEWWRITRWYKRHKTLNYVNNFSESDDIEDRPVWWPRHIAYMYYKSLNQTLDYFQNRWNIKIEDFRDAISSVEEIKFEDITIEQGQKESLINWIVENIDIWEPIPEALWWEKKRRVLRIGNHAVWLIIDEAKKEIRWYNAEANDVPFLKWLLTPIWVTKVNGKQKYIIKIEKQWWFEVVTLLPISWTITEFRKFMQNYWLMVPNKDPFFEELYKYVYSVKEEYQSTNKLWLQYIEWKKYVVLKSWTYIDEINKLYVSIEDAWDDIIHDTWIEENIKEYVEQLLRWYDWKISYNAFLLMILWVNAFWFRSHWIKLPQWFVFWLSQSGKTTFLNNLFNSFWIRKDISALSKAFVYEKYARHYVPTHFSEYRHWEHKQWEQLEGLVRNLFDWTPIEKGRADQTTVRYESNGLYVFDWQTIFTDDAAQTRMIILMANKRYQWSLDELETLPNIYNNSTNIFKSEEEFKLFVNKAREHYKRIQKDIVLIRSNNRMLENYSFLFALSEWLWLEKYNNYIKDAMLEQDWLTAQDDIQMIYQKIFNLQCVNRFDADIYKKWILINVVAEWMRINIDMKDLSWFIKTVNANFLWINWLPNLATYIDLDYVYKHQQLRWAFFRMMNYMVIDAKDKTDEEKTTIRSLYTFIREKCPTHQMINELAFEYNNLDPNKSKWEHTTVGEIE